MGVITMSLSGFAQCKMALLLKVDLMASKEQAPQGFMTVCLYEEKRN